MNHREKCAHATLFTLSVALEELIAAHSVAAQVKDRELHEKTGDLLRQAREVLKYLDGKLSEADKNGREAK